MAQGPAKTRTVGPAIPMYAIPEFDLLVRLTMKQVPSGNTFQRGQTITPRWVWNNHWNGFARFSIVPLGKENDKAAMNDPANFSTALSLLLDIL